MLQNLNLYKVFYTVANTKNISRAANQLYISQPAISKSIRKLEENLGCLLFHRAARGVTLTDEGRLLYERIAFAFQSIEAGEEEIARITELGIGQIRIGVSTTLCKYLLLPYLQAFIQANPHIKITIECQSTLHTVKLLEDGLIDIGLIGFPNTNSNIIFQDIATLQDTFVATKSYLNNLVVREAESDNLFANANLMLLDEENITRHYIDNYFQCNDIQTSQVLEVSSMDLLIEFAKIGLGVACVIKEFVQADITNRQLIEIPLKEPIQERKVGFAYSKSHSLSHAANQFLEFCLHLY